MVRPVIRADEPEGTEDMPLEDLVAHFGMLRAPPGADPPGAVVTADFQRNSSRLLVLLPSAGAPPGAWDTTLGSGHGAAPALLRWAEANGYAAALFLARAIEARPSELWDRVLRGNPSKCVCVAVAKGMLPMLEAALTPLHPVLYSRFRTVVVWDGSEGGGGGGGGMVESHAELRAHLSAALVRMPPAWAVSEPRVAHQRLFEILIEREERWQRSQVKKYASFQDLKENDMPGLRRLSVDKRIERLDRDRGNDELAQLLRKHENEDSEDEPGVD